MPEGYQTNKFLKSKVQKPIRPVKQILAYFSWSPLNKMFIAYNVSKPQYVALYSQQGRSHQLSKKSKWNELSHFHPTVLEKLVWLL